MGLIPKRPKRRHMLEFSLNITSLMDVLTVLLFFLIKSFSVTQTALTTPDGVRLPASTTKGQLEETVMVALSRKELRANDKVLVRLQNGKFPRNDLEMDEQTILPLKKFLNEQYSKRNEVYKSGGDASLIPPGKILIQSDKELPFGTLKFLLHTAAVSGYSDYQFVVMTPEN